MEWVDVAGSSTLNWGSGNIDADPLFVNPAGPDGDPNTWEDNDHHLSSSSPCIDAGDPNGDYAGQTDIDGQPRVIGPRVDMGSDEFALTLTVINGTGSGTYAQDQVVPISATVPPGTRFGQWTGDTANVADIYSASTTVVMKANTTLTATFVTLYTLTVTITGQGTVTPTGGTYPDGTKVTLTATADEGWHFVAWQNGATGTDPSVTVTMDADKIVEALFELDSSAPQPAPQDSNACCAGGGAAAPLACVWTWCAIALARGGAKRRR